MERWGAKHMIRAMFTGFKALPAPRRPWQEVLKCATTDPRDKIETSYKRLAKLAHPDAGGSEAAMSELNVALDAAKKERGW
jgi:hypothetical protein